MGESIAEGTIVRWIKKVGDTVDRDEPLFEISTDKVDAEIPAPAAGVLTEIKVKEGETVAVNSVVATIGTSSDVSSRQEPEAPPAPPPVAPARDAVVQDRVPVIGHLRAPLRTLPFTYLFGVFKHRNPQDASALRFSQQTVPPDKTRGPGTYRGLVL